MGCGVPPPHPLEDVSPGCYSPPPPSLPVLPPPLLDTSVKLSWAFQPLPECHLALLCIPQPCLSHASPGSLWLSPYKWARSWEALKAPSGGGGGLASVLPSESPWHWSVMMPGGIFLCLCKCLCAALHLCDSEPQRVPVGPVLLAVYWGAPSGTQGQRGCCKGRNSQRETRRQHAALQVKDGLPSVPGPILLRGSGGAGSWARVIFHSAPTEVLWVGLGLAPGAGTGFLVLSLAHPYLIHGSRVPWTLSQLQLVLTLHPELPDKVKDAQLNLPDKQCSIPDVTWGTCAGQ